MMDETEYGQNRNEATDASRRGRRVRPWHWQMILAALIALFAVEGEPVAATYATSGPAHRAAEYARRGGPAPTHAAVAASINAGREAEAVARDATTDGRPDFRVTFASFDDAQVGQPLSYTIQVRNDGGAAGVASISAVVPPELSNVRVVAPGFVCTRRFTPSGQQAGTLVTCLRNDLEGGAVADVTIEANAPNAVGTYHLTAVADPRDEVAEADEQNNEADVVLHILG
jgi:uncharacterized repeat protein (TIGR01451 family)